jgi:transposase InsO family protein
MSSTHKFLWATFDSLKDESGLLVRKIKPLISGKEQVVVIVPESLRREVISKCHDSPTSGHFYYWKTLKLVKRYFVWPGMGKDIQNYCLACHICATRKKAGRNRRAEMKHYDVGLPMEEICIDIGGPYPVTHKGNRYVLVIVDSFSKWMEAYPLPDIEAKTVAETLVREFISRFGVPFWIKSDRGRQFECKLFEAMCDLMDIEHKTSTAFHPQGNSRVERMVKVVVNLMSAYCKDQKDWDSNLCLLTLAYRSTIHEVTGYTPNYLMMGRDVYLPLDIMVGTIPGDQRQIAPAYIADLKERLQDAFKAVRTNLKSYAEQNKKYYDLRTHGEEFGEGDLVYTMKKTRQKGVSPKLDAKWKGPYLVVKKFGTIYEVQINRQTSKLLHFDLLKPCHIDINSVPPWLKRAQKKLLKN